MTNTLYALMTALFAFSSGALGWHFKSKKIAADAKGLELNNVEKAIQIWRSLAEEQTAQTKLQEKKIDSLTQQVIWLQGELKTLISENQNLRKTIEQLQASLSKNI